MDGVRLLRPEEAEVFVALRREALRVAPMSFGASPETDKGSDPDRMRVALRACGAEPEYAIVGAFAGGALVASAGVRREERQKRRHMAVVWGVYVTPVHRRRGLARLVVQGAVDHAATWPGVDVVSLTVSEGSPGAKALYESMGFVEWGAEPDSMRVDGRSLTEYYLQRRLRERVGG